MPSLSPTIAALTLRMAHAAEDELVAARVRAGGTHTREAKRGPWRGLTPEGTRYSTAWTAIFRVRDGKIVEQWLDSPGVPTASNVQGTEEE
jgi:ketosteroid isomerase-like protein